MSAKKKPCTGLSNKYLEKRNQVLTLKQKFPKTSGNRQANSDHDETKIAIIDSDSEFNSDQESVEETKEVKRPAKPKREIGKNLRNNMSLKTRSSRSHKSPVRPSQPKDILKRSNSKRNKVYLKKTTGTGLHTIDELEKHSKVPNLLAAKGHQTLKPSLINKPLHQMSQCELVNHLMDTLRLKLDSLLHLKAQNEVTSYYCILCRKSIQILKIYKELWKCLIPSESELTKQRLSSQQAGPSIDPKCSS
ncbi:unnamed protein product [Moneuplotes crassus]|uniref:Uncharacterized protein n=1 Tax=Euplotes crassus TaxID=5936 RepID=A0AAD1X6P9_EUPCR|nr:unnamed protein product [Moneuplotes crassus]